MEKTILYQKLRNNLVQCLACNHYCKVAIDKTGICSVRANINGKLKLLVYGKTTGLSVDPIEKKPLYHFLPGTTALSFGTFGCDFGCLFCQNWQTSQILKLDWSAIPTPLQAEEGSPSGKERVSRIQSFIDQNSEPATAQEIANAALDNNCSSIAYTYNEPAIFLEYALETMKTAKKNGLKNVFVSNGYESKESLDLIKDYLDAINIDIKGANETFYRKYCKAKLAPVLENVKRFHAAGIWVEVTTMIIENVNDSKNDLLEIAEFLESVDPGIPWHLSAMHPDFQMQDTKTTPYHTLEKAYEIGKEAGLKYVYAYTTEKSTDLDNSYCPKCNALLIERYFLDAKIRNLKKGVCQKCGERIEGVWC